MRFTSALAAVAVLAFTDVVLAAPAATTPTNVSEPASTPAIEECDSEVPDTTPKGTSGGSFGGLSLTAQLRLADM